MEEGLCALEVAAGPGVSKRTVCEWLSRYQQDGASVLENRRSRDQRSPSRQV
ncbi:MAG: hypothetical protein C4525_06005 [Desulfarculus sp.]|nr:MAG: hypothetical protein C4525_06005 [Desulfarculus sp.]